MQYHTCTTLFPNSTDLFEQSTFVILEKIKGIANNTQA